MTPTPKSPPTDGQVGEQPLILEGFAFRKRDELPGLEYCLLEEGKAEGPWFPFIPDSSLTAGLVQERIIQGMALLADRLVRCPTACAGVARDLSDLGNALRALDT